MRLLRDMRLSCELSLIDSGSGVLTTFRHSYYRESKREHQIFWTKIPPEILGAFWNYGRFDIYECIEREKIEGKNK